MEDGTGNPTGLFKYNKATLHALAEEANFLEHEAARTDAEFGGVLARLSADARRELEELHSATPPSSASHYSTTKVAG